MVDTSWAKPKPPEELTGIFGEISELEGKFESENWKEATEATEEISEEFDKMSAELKAVVGEKMVKGFLTILKSLEKSVSKEDEAGTEKYFIALQNILFRIMEGFDYKVHPVFEILKKHSADEALEALHKGDFEDVASEMKELLAFQSSTRGTLMKHGVTIEDLAKTSKKFKRSPGPANQTIKRPLLPI